MEKFFKYDLAGNKIETILNHSQDTSIKLIIRTTINSEGKKDKIAYYKNDTLQWQQTYKYDKKGNLIQEPIIFEDYYSSFIKYKYNKNNKLISAKERSSEGLFKPVIGKFKYDNNDSIIEIKRFNPKNKAIIKYNDKGYMMERTDYFYSLFPGYINNSLRLLPDYVPYYFSKYEYDDKGNRIADSTHGNIDIKNFYDIDSNLIEVKEIKTYERTERNIKFNYDDHGNWIKRTEIHYYSRAKGIPNLWDLTIREIEYY